jgi:multiple sugar transport system permease protein
MNKRIKRPFNMDAVKRKLTIFGGNLVLWLLMLGLCFMILQPLLNKLSISFMEEQDLYDKTVIAIPKHFTLENYKVALQLMDYGKSFMSTFTLAIAVAVLQVVSTLLVGYGFARYNFPLKKFWFVMVILMIVVPPQTYSSSLMLHFQYFDIFGIFEATTGEPIMLTGTSLPILLMSGTCTGLKCGLYIYLFRQYFRNVPKDIEEAAFIDGCGTLRTLFDVMLPDAMSLATSCFLFSFVWQWTDNYFSNLLMKSSNLLPIKLGALGSMVESFLKEDVAISPTYVAALNSTGTILVLIPVILLYLVAQKRFVKSLSASSLKM